METQDHSSEETVVFQELQNTTQLKQVFLRYITKIPHAWNRKDVKPNEVNLLVKMTRMQYHSIVSKYANECLTRKEEDRTERWFFNIPYSNLDLYLRYVLDDHFMVANEELLVSTVLSKPTKVVKQNAWKLVLPTYPEQPEAIKNIYETQAYDPPTHLLVLLMVTPDIWNRYFGQKGVFGLRNDSLAATLENAKDPSHEVKRLLTYWNAQEDREFQDEISKQLQTPAQVPNMFSIRHVLKRELSRVDLEQPWMATYADAYRTKCLDTPHIFKGTPEFDTLYLSIKTFVKEYTYPSPGTPPTKATYQKSKTWVSSCNWFTARSKPSVKMITIAENVYIKCPICGQKHQMSECIMTTCGCHPPDIDEGCIMGKQCFKDQVEKEKQQVVDQPMPPIHAMTAGTGSSSINTMSATDVIIKRKYTKSRTNADTAPRPKTAAQLALKEFEYKSIQTCPKCGKDNPKCMIYYDLRKVRTAKHKSQNDNNRSTMKKRKREEPTADMPTPLSDNSDMEFDESRADWRKNKIKLKHGEFRYKKRGPWPSPQ